MITGGVVLLKWFCRTCGEQQMVGRQEAHPHAPTPRSAHHKKS
jgi:hypothetical protein